MDNQQNKTKESSLRKRILCFFKFSLGTQDAAADIQDSAPLSKHPRK